MNKFEIDDHLENQNLQLQKFTSLNGEMLEKKASRPYRYWICDEKEILYVSYNTHWQVN